MPSAPVLKQQPKRRPQRPSLFPDSGSPAPTDGARWGSFSFIDHFAGIDGLWCEFDSIGEKCVLTREWNRCAQLTYQANCTNLPGQIMAVDVAAEQAEEFPKQDILLGGISCQPFFIVIVSKKNASVRVDEFANSITSDE